MLVDECTGGSGIMQHHAFTHQLSRDWPMRVSPSFIISFILISAATEWARNSTSGDTVLSCQHGDCPDIIKKLKYPFTTYI